MVRGAGAARMIARLKKWLRRPSRDELVRRLTVVTEERDVLQERVYDLNWHLERARNTTKHVVVLKQGEVRGVPWGEQFKRDFDADCC